MRRATGVQAVLFDSGGVLIRPIGGRWNPRFDFEATVMAHHPDLDQQRLDVGISAGDAFLANSATTPDHDDYHRVVLGAMGIEATPRMLDDLTREVDPRRVVEAYPEACGVVGTLRMSGVRLAVVSDAWPDLPRLHDAVGLGGVFEVYAISAELGCQKPDPRMYRHASDRLGLAPEACVFLDDDPHLVAAAIELGYVGYAVCRGGRPVSPTVPSIRDLTELLDLIGEVDRAP
jgi:putative hydrolase of the HAD superfamily